MQDDLPIHNTLERQLNEMALAAGRKRQSKQTGFIHYFYPEPEDDLSQTIPVAENVWFILALLRSKTGEQIAEAKDSLERLLYFQNPLDGNFTVYMHEYPHCKDKFFGAQLLPAFYYILKEFHAVLGVDLRHRLESAISHLLSFLLKAYTEQASTYSIGLKIAAAAKMLGIELKNKAFGTYGEQLLQQLLSMKMQAAWFIPSFIADICIALQLAYTHIQHSEWLAFWQHLAATWHAPTKSYIGPWLKLYQARDEPQPTLYDLYLGYFGKEFSSRALKEAAYHLQAVQIRPTGEFLPVKSLPFTFAGSWQESRWLTHQEKTFAYSLIDKKALFKGFEENAFHPLSIIWGNEHKVHSFVCQKSNWENLEFNIKDQEIELDFALSAVPELEEREKCRELSFFFDVDPTAEISLEGQLASTFELGETFILNTSHIALSLRIVKEAGEGKFMGHLMRGNRSSQNQLKGINRFQSYDWNVFIRTLRREATCKLKVRLQIMRCVD